MKNNKLITLSITSLLSFTFLTGCNSSNEANPTTNKNTFTLNESSKELSYGDTFKLSAFFASGNVEQITWSSSNNGVVSVNENGLVTAKNTGKAVIVAETESFSASCSFTVSFGKYLPELVINNTYNDEIIIAKGSDFIINPKIYYKNKSYDTSFDVYDYDEDIISYNAGVINAKKVGTTDILVSGNWNNAPSDLINKTIKVKVVDNVSFYCQTLLNGEKKISSSVDLSNVKSWCNKNYNTTAILEPVIYINGQYHLAKFSIEDNDVIANYGNTIQAKKPGTNVVDLYYEDSESGITYSSSVKISVSCPMENYEGETIRFSSEDKFPADRYFGSGATIISATQNGKELNVHDNYIDGLDQLGPDSSPIEIVTNKGGYYFPNVFIYTKLIDKTNIFDVFKLNGGEIKKGYYILKEDIDEVVDFSNQIGSNSSTYFAGVFDGQGHTVNARVGANGIFGGFGHGTEIKNCKFNLTFNTSLNKASYAGLANNSSTFINNSWEVKLNNLYITTTNFSDKCHALFEYRPNNLLMNDNYIEINGDDLLDDFTNVEQDYAALFKYDVTPLTGPSNQFYGDMRNNYVVTSKFMPLANGNFDGMKGRYVSYAKNDETYIKQGNELSMTHSVDRPDQSRYRIVYPSDQATEGQRKLYGFINVPELVETGVIPSLDTPLAAFYGSSYSDGGILRYNSKADVGAIVVGTWVL